MLFDGGDLEEQTMALYWEDRRGESWREALSGRAQRAARWRLEEKRRGLLLFLQPDQKRRPDDVWAEDMAGRFRELGRIEAALRRLDEGVWGFCDHCHEPIDLVELQVLPEAERCARCSTFV